MADKEVKFLLDLDVSKFTENALSAKGVIQEIGDSENLSGLLAGLAEASVALGAAGLAAFSFKEALDLTLEGEHIRMIEKQFDMLGETAGIATDDLKTGLEESAQGLISNTDLLETANKAIVAMGSSAAKLPDILELAKKATMVMGGTVKDNFDQITAAIERGNVRMLKHYGIIVNAEDATKKFAAAHGVAANELSESGKRQALLNAALEAGNKAYGDMNVDLTNATNTFQALKVTVKELGEVFTLAFERTLGPSVRKALGAIKDFAHEVKTQVTASFGEGFEKANAQSQLLEEKIKNLHTTLSELEAKKGTIRDLTPADTVSRIQAANIELKKYEEELEKVEQTKLKIEADGEKAEEAKKARSGKKGGDGGAVDAQKRIENEIKVQKELLSIRANALKESESDVQSLEQIDQIVKEKAVIAEQLHALKIRQIRSDTNIDAKSKIRLISEEERRYQQEVRTNENQTLALRKKLLTEYQKTATGVFDGIGRAFKAHSIQAKLELQDFNARGEQVFQSFQTHAVDAFEKMGESMAKGGDFAKSTAEAIKTAFLNMLADRAVAEGSLLMLSGIGSFNPVQIAAGAGLIALGGALRTLAGGSGDQVAGATGGGPGVSSGIGTPTMGSPDTTGQNAITNPSSSAATADTANPSDMQQTPQRVVHVNIAGNLYDTESTRRQLLDMIRAETDATDFRYQRIGGT